MASNFATMNTSVTPPTQEPTTMDSQTITQLTHTLQVVAIATLFLVICAYAPTLKRKAQLATLPAFNNAENREKQRQSYLTSANKMYEAGYAKFKESVYKIITDQGEENIVIPTTMLPELRKLSDNVLSFIRTVDDLMETKYTKLSLASHNGITSIKADLTPALARLNPIIASEVDSALRETMPPCEDWTEVNIFHMLVDVIAKVSGRIFVGPELCKNPEYIKLGTNYTLNLIDAVKAIKQVRPWLKPFVCSRLPEVVKLDKCRQRLREFIRPIIEERMTAKMKDPNWHEPDDMMQWMIKRGGSKVSLDEITTFQLTLIFAAIHTTSMTVTNILYTLVTTPEYLEPLREEIRNVMAANNGIITARALQQMEKIDSYMKEVIRFTPLGYTAFNRRVLKGITLSNGQYIPPGVSLEVPGAAVYQDSQHYPSPAEFDGFRSAKLRASGKAADIARNQFVTSNEINLNFGYGAHACPGRFFAANEIKMILVRLILEYDVKLPKGETERYKTINLGIQAMPDATKTLSFKKVHV